jgi:hypothetical protein
MIRENIKMSAKESLGYCELKKHKPEFKKQKPWLDEACSKLVDQRKQFKVQWLQDTSEINGDNLKIVRREASRYFKNKKKNKNQINELATNRRRTPETCIGEYINLIGATNQEIT